MIYVVRRRAEFELSPKEYRALRRRKATEERRLLRMAKRDLLQLKALLAKVSSPEVCEDGIYRFYQQSGKLQSQLGSAHRTLVSAPQRPSRCRSRRASAAGDDATCKCERKNAVRVVAEGRYCDETFSDNGVTCWCHRPTLPSCKCSQIWQQRRSDRDNPPASKKGNSHGDLKCGTQDGLVCSFRWQRKEDKRLAGIFCR